MNPTEDSGEPEMAELPASWKTLESGTPAPNWVAAIEEARRDINLNPAEATKRLRGMLTSLPVSAWPMRGNHLVANS